MCMMCVYRGNTQSHICIKVGYGHRVRRGQEIKGSKVICFRSVDISLTKGNNQWEHGDTDSTLTGIPQSCWVTSIQNSSQRGYRIIETLVLCWWKCKRTGAAMGSCMAVPLEIKNRMTIWARIFVSGYACKWEVYWTQCLLTGEQRKCSIHVQWNVSPHLKVWHCV